MELLSPMRPCTTSPSSYGAARASFFAGIGPASALVSTRNASSEDERRGRSGAVSVRAKGRKNVTPGRTPPVPEKSMPKLDDDGNPKFVIFIRTKNVPRWYPLSIVSGGTTAKVMLAAMKNEWGKKLYEGSLTRNIASVIYKDERAVQSTAFKTYPVLKGASGFQYGYKVVDPAKPRSALFGSDVVEIPPDQEPSFVEKVKDSFGGLLTGVKETFGAISPIEPQQGSEPQKK